MRDWGLLMEERQREGNSQSIAKTYDVLFVEDDPDQGRVIETALSKARYQQFNVSRVGCLANALSHLRAQPADVVLLDLSLPDAQGLEALHSVQASHPHVPVVVLSAVNDESTHVEAIHAGSQDFLINGQTSVDVIARSLCYAIERKRTEMALVEDKEELERRVAERTLHLETVTQQLGDEIQRRSQVETVLRERNKSLQIINLIADKLNGSLDLNQLVHQAVDSMVQFIRSPSVALYTVDNAMEVLTLVHSRGFDDETNAKAATLSVAGSLTGVAVIEKRVIASDDIETDVRIDDYSEGIRSAVYGRESASSSGKRATRAVLSATN